MKTFSRKYEATHPWITFEVDLRELPFEFWIVLGECQALCESLAGIPLPPEVSKALYSLYLAKGAHSTTAIEGNTLSEEQVLAIVDKQADLPPSQSYLKQEVENIIFACSNISFMLLHPKQPSDSSVRVDEIKRTNQAVLRNLPGNDNGIPGEISRQSVTVGRYRGAPREDCEYLLERLCEWLNGDWPNAGGAINGVGMAALKAVLGHLYLAWIHPFADGNGRTARLLEFWIMLSSGIPAPAAHLLSNHYNKTRQEYYRQLDLASRSGGDVMPFIGYALQGLRDGLREQTQFVQQRQFEIIWRNHVYEAFREKRTAGDQRRRQLILDLAARNKPVSGQRLAEISPKVAALYARKTQKTLSRDIKELERLQLLLAEADGYQANTETIRAFLPPRRSASTT